MTSSLSKILQTQAPGGKEEDQFGISLTALPVRSGYFRWWGYKLPVCTPLNLFHEQAFGGGVVSKFWPYGDDATSSP